MMGSFARGHLPSPLLHTGLPRLRDECGPQARVVVPGATLGGARGFMLGALGRAIGTAIVFPVACTDPYDVAIMSACVIHRRVA
jgi:hypothetical protein